MGRKGREDSTTAAMSAQFICLVLIIGSLLWDRVEGPRKAPLEAMLSREVRHALAELLRKSDNDALRTADVG